MTESGIKRSSLDEFCVCPNCGSKHLDAWSNDPMRYCGTVVLATESGPEISYDDVYDTKSGDGGEDTGELTCQGCTWYGTLDDLVRPDGCPPAIKYGSRDAEVHDIGDEKLLEHAGLEGPAGMTLVKADALIARGLIKPATLVQTYEVVDGADLDELATALELA